MKEESSKVFLKKRGYILGNIISQHLKFLLPLAIMTWSLYNTIDFEVIWLKLVYQVIVLFLIPIFSWELSKVTIRMTKNYARPISNGILYFLTILLLGVIYMFTSLFMLIHIVALMGNQLESSWLVILLVINSLVFALVHIRFLIRAYYEDIENKKVIEQAIMFIIIFCYGIPALLLTLFNAQSSGVIPGHFIIFINVLLAGLLSISLQGYKNAYNNLAGTVIFANYLQDFFALLIVFAALDLKMENSISFHAWLIFFTITFAGIRSYKEINIKA